MMAVADRDVRTIERVLCTLPFDDEFIEQVRQACAPAEFILCAPDDNQAIEAALGKVDVAVISGDLDDRYIDAPYLTWVHCNHSGLTRSARPEVFSKGMIVTGAAGRSAAALAQHGFYFALALTFDSRALFASQAAHVWRGIPGYGDRLGLAGKTLGIVGLGHTGREMARVGKAFHMKVVAFTRSIQPEHPDVDVLLCSERSDSLSTLIDQADVIMLATKLTDETYHMFSQREFARMRSSAYIINMARGPVIDEAALINALHAGEIAGAGLDVFSKEPLPADSPLWDVPNVIITPHMTPALPDRTQRSIDMIIENVARYRSGQPMLNALTDKDVFSQRP
ncbi:D-2-hydroxyacid dehydrogenase [Devosia nitrariae]|uniref:Hydroxyacid dehydrogenase n=1 Tax=Devosia nitrariae TaxID=2071872 RepID=A0ABQ5W492_9HYPH|nr:D-2-hydroxyacid dehydrogenase [Devosia nitrariae]GLQ54726.1 hydroxyacid dehydrogenase [Devosia nitrariae]